MVRSSLVDAPPNFCHTSPLQPTHKPPRLLRGHLDRHVGGKGGGRATGEGRGGGEWEAGEEGGSEGVRRDQEDEDRWEEREKVSLLTSVRRHPLLEYDGKTGGTRSIPLAMGSAAELTDRHAVTCKKTPFSIRKPPLNMQKNTPQTSSGQIPTFLTTRGRRIGSHVILAHSQYRYTSLEFKQGHNLRTKPTIYKKNEK